MKLLIPAVRAAAGINITENSIFQNQDARFAVSYAIDRQAIVDLVYNGRAELMQIWENACLRLAICNLVFSTAYSKDLQGPFLYRASQQIRIQDFKFAS